MKVKMWMSWGMSASASPAQTCDHMHDIDGQKKYLCEAAGNPTSCCTFRKGAANGIEYKWQIICAGPGERFITGPKGSEFDNCENMCGEEPSITTTLAAITAASTPVSTTLEVESTSSTSRPQACKGWCAGSRFSWAAKCMWKNCRDCINCAAMSKLQSCKPWCSTNSQPWSIKCTWRNCKQCGECNAPQKCKAWCDGHHNDWATKCTWKNCRQCEQCNKDRRLKDDVLGNASVARPQASFSNRAVLV